MMEDGVNGKKTNLPSISPEKIYFDGTNLKFTEDSNISPFFRIQFGYSYWSGFIIILAYLIINSYLADLTNEFSLFNTLLLPISILYVWILAITLVIRHAVHSIAELLDVRGTKLCSFHFTMRSIFGKQEIYDKFRSKIYHTTFELNKLDAIAIIISLLSRFIIFLFELWVYYDHYGNWQLAFFCYGTTGRALPWFGIIVEKIILYSIEVICMYSFTTLGLRMIATIWTFYAIRTYGEDIQLISLSKYLLTRSRAIDVIHNAYSQFLDVGFSVFKSLSKFVLVIPIIAVGIPYWLAIGGIGEMIIYSIGPNLYYFMFANILAIAFIVSLAVLPLFGFSRCLLEVREKITLKLDDLYEKTAMLFLTQELPINKKREFHEDLLVISNLIDYTKNMPIWPISIPEILRIIAVWFGSLLVSLLIR